MVNWYTYYDDSDSSFGANDGAVIPTLIRFGGRFNSSDFKAGTDSLGLFFDSDNYYYNNI